MLLDISSFPSFFDDDLSVLFMMLPSPLLGVALQYSKFLYIYIVYKYIYAGIHPPYKREIKNCQHLQQKCGALLGHAHKYLIYIPIFGHKTSHKGQFFKI